MRRPAGNPLAAALVVLIAVAVSAVTGGCGETRGSGKSLVRGVHLVRLPYAGSAAAWSPDGRRFASAGAGGLLLRDPDGRARRTIAAPPLSGYFGPAAPIVWLDDGRRLAYLSERGGSRRKVLWATEISRTGGPPRQTSLDTRFAAGAWSPRDWPLAFLTGAYERNLQGRPVGPAAALWLLAGPGEEPRRLRPLPGTPWEPVQSPRGEELAFTTNNFHRGQLWIVGLDGSPPRRLSRAGHIARPAFSPDGRLLAFAAIPSWGDGRGPQLYVIPSHGGKRRLLAAESTVGGPEWSPDGHWIAYSNDHGEIRRVAPGGGPPETVAKIGERELVNGLHWSPDGRRLTYTAYEPQVSD